ncbi:hypothetical protein GCM10008910_37130 [Faecalicatena orotica]|uniref:Uncharacterized protein n=1 Tax=Faecalicatena orotica TaxID=1544 RepID=A0A2Y9BCK5_9FIRM|nr:hypothetical protein [Faecalicatena orotica]PWJ30177.1 hypothetical protein A8806_10440 [Faecalicatena orotica]SSA55166.1 hypothetical protein SAMN05216536_10440 [Faecalicatena orotica]
MTEQKFENTMEHFGDTIEKTFEGAAKILDKSLNLMWSIRPVRLIGKTFAFLTGAGLIAGAVPLDEKGYHKAAKACFICGGLILLAQIIELAILRKK